MGFVPVQDQHLHLSNDQHRDAGKELKHPAGGRVGNWFTFLVREGGLMRPQGRADAILQGGLD